MMAQTRSPLDRREAVESFKARTARVEKELAASLERFYSIFNAIGEAIILYDEAGRIVEVNAAATLMYGWSREEFLTLEVVDRSSGEPPYTQAEAGAYIELACHGEAQSFEWRAKRRDGALFWVNVNLKQVSIGSCPFLLSVVRDITEHKRLQEADAAHLQQLLALNKKLEDAHLQLLQSEKMASIGQLAAGVAHEINNPIGFVTSNLGSLERYLEDIFAITNAYERAEAALGAECEALDNARIIKQEKDLEFLKTDIPALLAESREGLQRVAKIIADLKDFSRPGDATAKWSDLNQGLDSTINIVWNELKYKCSVKKDYGELPPVWCVPSQINQVFMNLLVNAAQAIPERGEITIRTGQSGEQVFVRITDTGVGIPAENLKRIFDPFFTTKPVGKGTGLGLSLVFGIVQKHRGRIEVANEPVQGASFTVWLPIMPSAEDAAEAIPDRDVDVAPTGDAVSVGATSTSR